MQKNAVRLTLSTTPLGGAATFTGAAIKVPSGATKIAVAAFADQTGNVIIDQSRDGATWRAAAQTAITASTLLTVEARLVMPWVRVRLINGATPQTVLDLTAAFVES